MRIESWNPNKFDESFEGIILDRMVEAAEIVAERANHALSPGKISRPEYRSGKGGGKNWTARNPGTLKRSVRVVRKKVGGGKAFSRKRNVRIYAGHYLGYYAHWVEFGSSTIKRKHREKTEGAIGRRKRRPTARDIEFGTSRIAPRAFLRTAFYSSGGDIKYILGAT
jgi:hypothetical protein